MASKKNISLTLNYTKQTVLHRISVRQLRPKQTFEAMKYGPLNWPMKVRVLRDILYDNEMYYLSSSFCFKMLLSLHMYTHLQSDVTYGIYNMTYKIPGY